MISIQSMTFGYGKKPLFDRMDLALEGGAIYGLLGLNGAGKTSLLKLMAGALLPHGGEIEVFGRNPAQRQASHLADVAFVAEDPWVPPIKPAAWLERFAPFRPAFDRMAFDRLFSEFELEGDKLLSRYSYGQRKKFCLAAALASGARTVLLDEPTNGLDIPSKTQFRKILAASSTEERVIIVSTHQIRDLENLIDPILIMDRGKMPFTLGSQQLATRLHCRRLNNLAGQPVIHAQRDTLGWSALLAGPAGTDDLPADLEMVFNAAITQPERLTRAMSGQDLGEYPQGGL
jgi:ABC-2 type transport system ATP-binding protein